MFEYQDLLQVSIILQNLFEVCFAREVPKLLKDSCSAIKAQTVCELNTGSYEEIVHIYRYHYAIT